MTKCVVAFVTFKNIFKYILEEHFSLDQVGSRCFVILNDMQCHGYEVISKSS